MNNLATGYWLLATSQGPEARGQRLAEPQIEAVSAAFEISRIEPLRIEPTRIEPPAASDQLVIKLVTDDPEVVIVWLVDQKQNGG